MWIDAQGNPNHKAIRSDFHVVWPDKKKTAIGLNEFRDIDGAVLYTKAIGASTRTPYGIDLVLEQNGSAPWLPLGVGKTFSARVKQVYPSGNAPIPPNCLVLSLGPRVTTKPAKIEAGMVIEISTSTKPEITGAQSAIGGGPTLIEGGKPRQWGGYQSRHPRSAIGSNKDFIYLVEVDGRQRSLSIGMTFPELSQYMLKLGCQEAINLDGGGSSTLWVMGNVMNSPCQGNERPSANALVLLYKQKK